MGIHTLLLTMLIAISCSACATDTAAQLAIGDMVLIDGGTFQMGDVLNEGLPREQPVHQVTVANFELSAHEVTVEQFEAFIADTGYTTSARQQCDAEAQRGHLDEMKRLHARLAELGGDASDEARKEATGIQAQAASLYATVISLGGAWCCDPVSGSWNMQADADWRNPHIEQAADHPVTCVSWIDAIHYCNWLSRKAGLPVAYDVNSGNLLDAEGDVTADIPTVTGFRLPTEAEWEYAARERGRKVRFGNGRDIARSTEINFNASAADCAIAERGEYRCATTPVGSFKPNRLGLHDMAGNVWEWCSDFVGPYGGQPQVNPCQTEGIGQRRAARGGRWGGLATELRASARFGWTAEDRCNSIGFRVARSKRRGDEASAEQSRKADAP